MPRPGDGVPSDKGKGVHSDRRKEVPSNKGKGIGKGGVKSGRETAHGV